MYGSRIGLLFITKNMPQRSQELKLFYEDELARAVKEDADITSTYIAPKVYYPDTAT